MYAKRMGVKIRPYDLRHTFALQFLRNGGHALALQKMLGHADLTMTKRYVALAQQDIREQHAFASPLNTLLPKKHRVRTVIARVTPRTRLLHRQPHQDQDHADTS